MDESQVWQLNRRAGSRHRRFGAESVLYDGVTGDSHLLTGVASSVVASLYERARSAAECAEDLFRGAADPSSRVAFRETVEQTLRRLDRRGLVSRRRDDDSKALG